MEKVHYIQNNDIDYVKVLITYKKEQSLVDDVYNRLLKRVLYHANKDYPVNKDFVLQFTEKCILSTSYYGSTYGNTSYMNYSFNIPRVDIIDDYDFEKAFKFAVGILFNPLIIDNGFKKEYVSFEKKRLLNELEDDKNNMYCNNFDIFYKNVKGLALTTDEMIDIVKNINEVDLYEYYKKASTLPREIYVFGNFDEILIDQLLDKYIDGVNTDFNIESYYDVREFDDYHVDRVKVDYNQTSIFDLFRIKDYSEKDNVYMQLLYRLLGTNNGLLLKKVRFENNMAYEVNMNSSVYRGYFYLNTYIKQSDFDKYESLIKDAISDLRNIDYVKERVAYFIEDTRIAHLRNMDAVSYIFDLYIDEHIKLCTDEKLIELFSNIDYDYWHQFIDRIEASYTLVCEGNIND